jgi:hypothetical protein
MIMHSENLSYTTALKDNSHYHVPLKYYALSNMVARGQKSSFCTVEIRVLQMTVMYSYVQLILYRWNTCTTNDSYVQLIWILIESFIYQFSPGLWINSVSHGTAPVLFRYSRWQLKCDNFIWELNSIWPCKTGLTDRLKGCRMLNDKLSDRISILSLINAQLAYIVYKTIATFSPLAS